MGAGEEDQLKLGMRDNMLRGGDWEERFAEARELGLHGVEISILDDYQAHTLWQEGGIDRLNRLRNRHGLEIAGLSLGDWMSRDFRHPDDAVRAEGIRLILDAVRITRELGANTLLVPFFGAAPMRNEEVTSPRLLDGFRACLGEAESRQVRLAIESIVDAEHHLALIASLGAPYVGVYYDLANATLEGYDVAAEIRLLGARLFQVHLKETGPGVGRTGAIALGTGDVPWARAREALWAVGYDGWLVMEVRPTPQVRDPSLEFARSFFGL